METLLGSDKLVIAEPENAYLPILSKFGGNITNSKLKLELNALLLITVSEVHLNKSTFVNEQFEKQESAKEFNFAGKTTSDNEMQSMKQLSSIEFKLIGNVIVLIDEH